MAMLRRASKLPINNIKFSPKEVPPPAHIAKALKIENTTVTPPFARDEAFPVNQSKKTVVRVLISLIFFFKLITTTKNKTE